KSLPEDAPDALADILERVADAPGRAFRRAANRADDTAGGRTCGGRSRAALAAGGDGLRARAHERQERTDAAREGRTAHGGGNTRDDARLVEAGGGRGERTGETH